MRRYIFSIVVFLFSVNTYAQDTALSRMYRKLGNKLYAKKDYDAALQNYNLALKENPKSKEALSDRIALYSITKQKDLKLKDLSTLISIDPKDDYSYNRRAGFYVDEKKYDLALRDYNTALQINPSSFNYSSRARLNATMNKTNDAINDYKAAIKIKETAYLYTYLAELYLTKKDTSAALAAVDKAVKLVRPSAGQFDFSTDHEAYYLKGKIYYWQKKYREAIEEFTRYQDWGVSLFSKWDVHYYLAMCYCATGEYEKMEKEIAANKIWNKDQVINCDKKEALKPSGKSATNNLNSLTTAWKRYDLTGTGLSIQSPKAFKMITNVPDPFIETQNAFVMWSSNWDDIWVTVTYEGSTNNLQVRDKLEKRKKYILENGKNATAAITGDRILGHPSILFKGEKTDTKKNKKMISEEIMYGEFGNLTSISVEYPAGDKNAEATISNLFKSFKEDGSVVKSNKLQPDANWTTFKFNGLQYRIPTRNEEVDCDKAFGSSNNYQTSINACYDWGGEMQIRIGYKIYKDELMAPSTPQLMRKQYVTKEKELDDLIGSVISNSYKEENFSLAGFDATRLVKTEIAGTVAYITDHFFLKKGSKIWHVQIQASNYKNYLEETRKQIIASLKNVNE